VINLNFSQLVVLVLLLTVGTLSGILVNTNSNPNVQLAFNVRHPLSKAQVLQEISEVTLSGERSFVEDGFRISHPKNDTKVTRAPAVFVEGIPNETGQVYAVQFSYAEQKSSVFYSLDGGTNTGMSGMSSKVFTATEFNTLNEGWYQIKAELVKKNKSGSGVVLDIDTINVYFQPDADEVFPNMQPTCACKSMKVVDDPNALITLDFFGITQDAGLNNLGSNEVSNPDGSKDYKYLFEVQAELEEGSDPKLCDEYQKIKATTKRGGQTGYVGELTTVVDGKPKIDQDWGTKEELEAVGAKIASFSGDFMAFDNYEEPSEIKIHGGNKIVWIDGPGALSVIQSELPMSYEAEFESVVAPGCKCTSTLKIGVDKNGKLTSNLESDCK
jgi:hypothetical protein